MVLLILENLGQLRSHKQQSKCHRMFQINEVIFILSIFQQQLGQAVTCASFTVDMHCVFRIRLHINYFQRSHRIKGGKYD